MARYAPGRQSSVASIATTSSRMSQVRSRSPGAVQRNITKMERRPSVEVTYPSMPEIVEKNRNQPSDSQHPVTIRPRAVPRKRSYVRERPSPNNSSVESLSATRSSPRSSSSTPASLEKTLTADGFPVQLQRSPSQPQSFHEDLAFRPYPASRASTNSSSFYTRTSSPDRECNQRSSSYASSSSSHSSRDDDFNDKLPRRMQPLPRINTNSQQYQPSPAKMILNQGEKEHHYHTLSPRRFIHSPHFHDRWHHQSSRRANTDVFDSRSEDFEPAPSQRAQTFPTPPAAPAKSILKTGKRVHFDPEVMEAKNGHERYMPAIRGEWDRIKNRHSRSRSRVERDDDSSYEKDSERRRRHHGHRSSRRRRDDYYA